MSESFEKALKNIPKVSEFKLVSEYKHWKAIVQRVKRIFKVSNAEFLDAVVMRISGEIAQDYQAHNIASPEQLWAHMDETYGDTHDTNRTELLYTLTHPPASVKTMHEYNTHFREYLTRLPYLIPTEELKIAIYSMPLSKIINQGIITQSPITLEEAKTVAERCSLMIPDHIFREGLSRSGPVGKPKESTSTANLTPSDSSAETTHRQERDKSTMQCYYCKQTGHLARSCKWKANHNSQPNGPNRNYKRRNDRRVNFKSQRNSPRHFIDIRENSKN